MIKIIISFLLLFSRGYVIQYDHIDGAESGFYTVYNSAGDCVADDIQLSGIVELAEE